MSGDRLCWAVCIPHSHRFNHGWKVGGDHKLIPFRLDFFSSIISCCQCHRSILHWFSPLGKVAERAIYFTLRNLARSANLPEGLYVLPSVISSFFTRSKVISVSTGPIFTIFSPNGRYLREFSWSGPFFLFLKGCCHGNQFCFVPDSFARSRSISGSAGPIFTIFSPYESALRVDDRSVLYFPICQGTLPW